MGEMPYSLIANIIQIVLGTLNISTSYGKLSMLFGVAANLYLFRDKIIPALDFILKAIMACVKIFVDLLPLLVFCYAFGEFYTYEASSSPLAVGGGIAGGIRAFIYAGFSALIPYALLNPNSQTDPDDRLGVSVLRGLFMASLGAGLFVIVLIVLFKLLCKLSS